MEQQFKQIHGQQKAPLGKFLREGKSGIICFKYFKPMGKKPIGFLNVNETNIVLDITDETGEPALNIKLHE